MDTKITNFVGGWSRKDPGRGAEERYICGKLRDAGYRTAFATNVCCLHLFGTKDTDRWGYPANYRPEDTGHSDIYHPALENGDQPDEIEAFTGKELTEWYLS